MKMLQVLSPIVAPENSDQLSSPFQTNPVSPLPEKKSSVENQSKEIASLRQKLIESETARIDLNMRLAKEQILVS